MTTRRESFGIVEVVATVAIVGIVLTVALVHWVEHRDATRRLPEVARVLGSRVPPDSLAR